MSHQPSSAFTIQYPEWQREYEAALLETNLEVLAEKIAYAEAAIFRRLEMLAQLPSERIEHQAIEDALQNLRVLKRAELARVRAQDSNPQSTSVSNSGESAS